MCIAISKPAETKPDWVAYEQGFRRNPDGWGFAVPQTGRVLIRKDVTSFDEFRRAFEPFADEPALVHFRIKTHGDISKRMCHPFRISEKMAMIHNGMLDIECNLNAQKSDTWHFVKQVLRPMAVSDPRFCFNQGTQFLSEQFIGYNKCVFMTHDGEFCHWNKSAGTVAADGHWYSNNTYEKPKPFKWPDHGYSSKRSARLWADNDSRAIDDWTAYNSRDTDTTYYDSEDDDPIRRHLGQSIPMTDYEAAQGCLQLGLPISMIAELYGHDPSLLETIAYYHDDTYFKEER